MPVLINYMFSQPRDCLIGSTTRTDALSSASCPKYVSLPEYVSPGKFLSYTYNYTKGVLKMVMPHSHGYLNMKLSETAAGLCSIA
ncbi:hypothetical protein C3L33_04411, partial [Rhododendron williamsianum]